MYKLNNKMLEASAILEMKKSFVTALAFSPNEKLLAGGDQSGKILVFDTETKEVKINQWAFHTGRINGISWSENGEFAASASLDTNIYIWSVEKPMKYIAIKGNY